MAQPFDCLVAGSCVLDLLCRPVNLDKPIGHNILYPCEPVVLTAGGITSNSGITMARLGLKVGVLSYVGSDEWGGIIRGLYRRERIDESLVLTHPTQGTSTTVVAIDPTGERSFWHCVGAPKEMDASTFLDRLEVFRQTRLLLMGYYGLMPKLEADLPRVFAAVRAQGCQTAMDAAGAGGTMKPLDQILPHLDVWVPSLSEAKHQTGHDDPRKIIETYRHCGAPGLLGVKLGSKGVMLSPMAGQFIELPVCNPPGELIDTTGAGDSFFAGLLVGLLKGLSVEQAGRLGAASAACCLTAVGGWVGARDYQFTAKLAGVA